MDKDCNTVDQIDENRRDLQNDIARPCEETDISKPDTDESGNKKPVDYDNMSVDMIRRDMEDIPQYDFPEGFGIRHFRRGEGTLWVDIQHESEPYFEVTEKTFDSEFGDDLEALKSRSFFIINKEGTAVGTITSWYDRNYMGQDFGRIHWVAIRPAYQGLKLSKPAMTVAMNHIAKWHDRCVLTTSTGRTGALKVYLDFGFRPVLDTKDQFIAWSKVQERLHHPLLQKSLDKGYTKEDVK